MWPWGHVASAYLIYAVVAHARGRGRPGGAATVAVALGALAPDLIDKPLAWYLAVLPHGRTFAHSLLLGGVLVAVGVVLAHHYGEGRIAGVFAIGYIAHIAGDGLGPLISGSFGDLFYAAWPLASPPYEETIGLFQHVRRLEITPLVGVELLVTAVGLALWWHHGRPGAGLMARWVRRHAQPTS